jgi:hypothetical protein
MDAGGREAVERLKLVPQPGEHPGASGFWADGGAPRPQVFAGFGPSKNGAISRATRRRLSQSAPIANGGGQPGG